MSTTERPTIQALPSGTAVFLGPTLIGPDVGSTPELLRSFADFERTYGGLDDLHVASGSYPNYVAHAARVFFENGGTRLHVIRVALDVDHSHADVHGYVGALRDLQHVQMPYMLAAPGFSARADSAEIRAAFVAHVDVEPGAFLILDAPPHATSTQLQRLRREIDTPNAALYHPWIVIGDSTKGRRGPQLAELHMPPSAFVCGILARNDHGPGLSNAADVRELIGALGLEQRTNHSDVETLLSIGVNCVRWSPTEGARTWGATTLSSNAAWRYVNVRRYVTHFERTIARGLRWTAQEPDGSALRSAARQAVAEFLYGEWQRGAFLGVTPEQAFFVHCHEAASDADGSAAGGIRLVVGLAILKAAEFLEFTTLVNCKRAN